MKIMTFVRVFRSKHLSGLGRFFLRIGISANLMTFIALICGIISAYYLFDNYYLFLIFGSLHIIGDGLDGVIARVSKETKFGHYLDYLSDRLYSLLLLIKISWYLNDYYVYIVIGIFALSHIINLLSDLKLPVFYSRTTMFIILLFSWPVLAYLIAGVVSLYSLTLQFKEFLTRRLS